MEFTKVILTSVLSVFALFIITKIMGHKQIAQLDFFDYVSGITIGSIGAELATELENPYNPLISLVIYGGVSMLLNLCTQKIARTRKYINGAPTLLFDNGKIYRDNLKKSKLDLSEFMMLCREQGYFDLCDMQTAVYEPNGKISILPKASKRPATPADLNVFVSDTQIGIEVIMDGRIMRENLARMGLDEKWLQRQISNQGYKRITDIFLGIYQKDTSSLSLYPNK